MPATFIFRSQCVKHALKAGFKNFRTTRNLDGLWVAHYEPGDCPAAEWATGRDFVSHVETKWVDGVRTGVVVVRITKEEVNDLGDDEKIPAEFQVEPINAELWGQDPTKHSPTRPRRDGAVSAHRAKSDVESPVKVVWRIAGEMQGKPRAEIIAACVEAGVNNSTANTQYYKYCKAQG